MKKTLSNRRGTYSIWVSIFVIMFLFISSAAVSASNAASADLNSNQLTAVLKQTAAQVVLIEDNPYRLYLPLISRPPNPAPTLAALSPTSTNAGGADFTLIVYGTNFIESSIVNWNGNPQTTTFVSATQLTAAIAAADIAAAGIYPVTVTSPAPGGGTSNAFSFPVINLVPTLTALNPASINVGGADFILTVDGTNFNGSSVVNWNGSPRTTTFVSTTQLTAAITAADISAAGIYPVTVINPAPGGGISNALNFIANPGNPVLNGNFEASGANWTQYSAYGWGLILQSSELLVTPHGGSYAAWLGGEIDETSRLTQTNINMAGVRYLHYWNWIASADDCGYDFARVKVNDAVKMLISLCYPNNTGGWVHQSIDLNGYTGTITLQFEVTTNNAINSNFFLDDISITSSAAAGSQTVDQTALDVIPQDMKDFETRRHFPSIESNNP